MPEETFSADDLSRGGEESMGVSTQLTVWDTAKEAQFYLTPSWVLTCMAGGIKNTLGKRQMGLSEGIKGM